MSLIPPGAPPALEITVEPQRDRVRVAPVGELDLATVGQLRDSVTELRDAGFSRFELDLRGLTFVDSTGLQCLLALSRDAGLEVRMVPGPRPVQRVFELAGVVGLLPLTSPARSGVRPSGDG